jgi:hypothetical protein
LITVDVVLICQLFCTQDFVNWISIGDPVSGTWLAFFTDPLPPAGRGFYQIRDVTE